MSDCIFCGIAAGEIPATIAFCDDDVVAIEDLNPQAPSHLLVIPVEHHGTIGELAVDPGLTARVIAVASGLGRRRGGERGYRLVINTGADGGQTVGHVHVHVLSGREMTWPPG